MKFNVNWRLNLGMKFNVNWRLNLVQMNCPESIWCEPWDPKFNNGEIIFLKDQILKCNCKLFELILLWYADLSSHK